MPVEIKELVIRAKVEHQRTNEEDQENDDFAQHSAANNEDMIQECVRQVLRILEKKKER